MPGFYYFVELPTDQLAPQGTLAEDVLADCGLADVLADCRVVNTDVILSGCEKGPGGVPGIVITPIPVGRELTETVQYRPQKQTWAEVAGPKARHWIGWLTDAPPGPDDLRRKKLVPGRDVAGASERLWTIPIARSPVGGATLPQNIIFAGGEPVTTVKPQFAELWEMSGRVWDLVFSPANEDAKTEMSNAELIRIVMAAIATNYRVGPAEISALESAGVAMLDTDLLRHAGLALVDADAAAEFQKKTN